MNLIDHVRYELRRLDESGRALRKFGFTMSAVFTLIAAYTYFFHRSDILAGMALLFTLFLACPAVLRPTALRRIRRYWMALALTLGWFISRLFLVVFFYIVLTPVSLFARLTGKKFLQPFRTEKAETYWVKRSTETSTDYTKMY